MKPGPCAKTRVICTLITKDRQKFVGENLCKTPQTKCPRKPGDGYEKCRTVCGTIGHAEMAVLKLAEGKTMGASVYLEGHTHICVLCMRALKIAGVTKPVIGKPPAGTRKHHELKTDTEPFAQTWLGNKPWEFRKNDRDFKEGDTVTLKEHTVNRDFLGCTTLHKFKLPIDRQSRLDRDVYSGREITGTIEYVLLEGYGTRLADRQRRGARFGHHAIRRQSVLRPEQRENGGIRKRPHRKRRRGIHRRRGTRLLFS